MTDQNARSLPPLVDGNVYGHLLVTVDEILWCKKCPGEVIVLLQWWGDIDSVIFRPTDVSKYPDLAKCNNSVKYDIRTNFSLFETYLKQCNKLKLLVINDGNKEIIGHVEVDSLQEHVTNIQLQKYFPILISSGTRIGDLRIDFDLSMNSVPEEVTKKTRKRSRKKTKSGNSFRSVIEEEKIKQFKKGCKTCADHIKPIKKSTAEHLLNLEMPESPKTNQVPPNTERSNTSEYVLLEVLEKGKKLRDAMVLSVLEDSDVPLDVNEELLLKLNHDDDKYNKFTYKSRNGEIVSPHEEKLISNYLEGKTMKEEEEKLVLSSLHPENHEKLVSEQKDFEKQEGCCLVSKTGCPHAASSCHTTGATSTLGTNAPSQSVAGDITNLMKRINCFRLTVDCLTLTPAGWRKINQAIDKKNKSGDTVPPPGATYFVECNFVEDSPRTQAQLWKARPLRFCSRRQIQDVVYFGQSSAHALRPPHSVSELDAVNCLVCWRHLHQRVPALLGTFRLAPLLQGQLEVEDSLPVVADNVTVVAHVKLKLQFGRDKLYFGNALLEDSSRGLQTEKKPLNYIEQNRTVQANETALLDVKDLQTPSAVTEDCGGSSASLQQAHCTSTQTATMLPTRVAIPVCANCGQNLVLTNVNTSPHTSLCIGCSNLLAQHRSVLEPHFKISVPKNFTSKEKRHHEFLLGIDTVKGFPLFASVDEELSCYVDYKFPTITSGLKAELSHTETTSRVVAVEQQPSLASVLRHSLTLPVVLPLSPLLAGCCSGVTLRLWVRYYNPTPRDHMVAMALLPMDELCLMELEFDERQQDVAVTKVFELPLALVPSSVTAPYQKCKTAGSLRVSVTYSNFITPSDTVPPSTGNCEKSDITLLTKDISPELRHDSFVERDIKPISALLDRISSDKINSIAEEQLKAEKNRFWTGPFGNDGFERSKHVEKSIEDSLNKKEECITLETSHSQNDLVPSKPLNEVDIGKEGSDLRSSRPIMKEDLDLLAESIAHKFNQLQSNLLKEKQRGLTDINSIVTDTIKLNSSVNYQISDNLLSFHSSLSSNSSVDSLPFMLGPPADIKDIQNAIVSSKSKVFSDSLSDKSVSDTIVGFLKEETNVANYGSNDSFDKLNSKSEAVKPKTFKAKIKIDRAVNLKAVKTPSNGKKSKVPPSSWVSFGISEFCEQRSESGRFTTPVIRRNHNPIWNLAWDVDLPVEYLQQEDKRLVFDVFEEHIGLSVGQAAASIAILRSGLPCLSSWLSIDDSQGSCRGQLKVVVTPLEDVRHYQDCSVFDLEEDEFEDLKEKIPETLSSGNGDRKATTFIASHTEVFLNERREDSYKEKVASNTHMLTDKCTDIADATDGDDPFLADDVISDYKNTLENNFRNEMAGLENLIKFLRVGSMSSELSFFRSTENKENLSSNPSPQHLGGETRTTVALESHSNICHIKNQPLNHNNHKSCCFIDASTETSDKDAYHSVTAHQSSEDILTKLLQQISTFQPAVIKITDGTSQTLTPETVESSTDTNDAGSQLQDEVNRSVCMRDASTETVDLSVKQLSQSDGENRASHHVCEEIGNVLLKHFLTCKPPPVKVADSTTQTDSTDGFSTVNSSGVFTSGTSMETYFDKLSGTLRQQNYMPGWIQGEAQTSSERLSAIDNNIRDLEQFLKNSLTIPGGEDVASLDSKGGSSVASFNITDCSGRDKNQTSSDVESLENYSQIVMFPRKTPDGGNPLPVTDTQTPKNGGTTETTLRRRGTFVIEKSSDVTEEPKQHQCGEFP